jgi:hypothetical protein
MFTNNKYYQPKQLNNVLFRFINASDRYNIKDKIYAFKYLKNQMLAQ